jgi:NAD-dependent DNA ligase
MSSAMERMLNDINRLVIEIDRLNQAAAAAKTAFDNTIADKDSTIASKTKDFNDLQASAATREQELNGTINNLQLKVRESENALEEEKKARKTEVTGLKAELTKAAQDVVKAKDRKLEREVPIGPDGEVLAVTDAQDMVVLNRGKDKHMMAGLTFDVYEYVKGAVARKKAVVVVIGVDATTSRARVLELLNPMVPIVKGDLFESVAYNPNEQIHFFLLGRFEKYGKSDAAKRLTDLGAKVDTDVTVDTDFLVLGQPEAEDQNLRDTDAYKHAVELGVKILTEAQLSQFLLY